MRRATWLLIGLLLPWVLLAQPPELWFYYSANLLPDENIRQLEQVWRQAAKAGYSKVLLADFKFGLLGRLKENETPYFAHVKQVRALADELGLQIVPAIFPIGYSNSLLANDPNLAEGLPVRDALFVVKNGEAQLQADPPVSLAAKPDWQDKSFSLPDRDGVVQTRGHSGNARLVWKIATSPYRCYHVSVQARSRNYSGEVEIKPIVGGSRVLAFTKLHIQPTQDWTEHHMVFGSLEHSSVSIYMGIWGDAKGELELRNWQIEEAGPVNVLRRPGAPCVVNGYVEGRDYEPIVDPKLGMVPWAGDYSVWHQPPTIRTKLPEGTKLRISWYFPMVIHDDQVCCCPSEPRVQEILADQAGRVNAAWEPAGMMMSHDEVRVLNQDKSCLDRELSPGQILADNVAYCARLLPQKQVYVWSDMFDPHHNAVRDFYLVNGDLAESWKGLEPRITVVNWNFDKREESMRFFASRGHQQVIAAYYDAPLDRTRQWLESAKSVAGISGIMYTTWEQNYRDLEAFAALCREVQR